MATNEQLLEAARERNIEGVNSRSSKADLEAALEKDGFDLSTLESTDTQGGGDKDADAQTTEAEGVQEAFDAEHEQGFRGTKVDPTPNEAYTVAGVTSGQPTPETDPALRAEARTRAFGELEGGQTALTEEREPGQGK